VRNSGRGEKTNAMSKRKQTKKPTRSKAPNARTLNEAPISDALKAEIERRELSAYALGKLASVHLQMITRFISGERDLRLATADKIAAALGMKLVASRE
jgi:hypothetical protein